MEPPMPNCSMRHQNPDLDFDDTRMILQGASYTIAANMVAASPHSGRAGGPHELCFMQRGRSGWVVGGTMNPSPSTDRQYVDFNRVYPYKAGTYAAGTRYLRGSY